MGDMMKRHRAVGSLRTSPLGQGPEPAGFWSAALLRRFASEAILTMTLTGMDPRALAKRQGTGAFQNAPRQRRHLVSSLSL
jgi:hypothetical protein